MDCFLVQISIFNISYHSGGLPRRIASKKKIKLATSLGAVFERVTKNSVRGIWSRRSKLNLVGAHINVFTGEWTQKVCFCPLRDSLKAIASISC